jgi:hypothetical protein
MGAERSRRRSITIAPRLGGSATLPEREAKPATAPPEAEPVEPAAA